MTILYSHFIVRISQTARCQPFLMCVNPPTYPQFVHKKCFTQYFCFTHKKKTFSITESLLYWLSSDVLLLSYQPNETSPLSLMARIERHPEQRNLPDLVALSFLLQTRQEITRGNTEEPESEPPFVK